jgi:hypothetical protein
MYWNYATFVGGIWSADPTDPDCIRTQGKVVDIRIAKGNSKGTMDTYYIVYTYTVGGNAFENDEKVTFNLFNRLTLNGNVDICYMKDHPSRSAAIGNDVRGEDGFLVVLVDIAFLVIMFLIFRHMWRGRRKDLAAGG